MNETQGREQAQRNELAAWRDMGVAATREWSGAHGFSVAQRDGLLAISLRDLPVGMFNRAFGLGDDHAVTPEEVEWAQQSVPHHRVWLQLSPNANEAASTDLLARLGFEQIPMRWAQLAKPLDEGEIEVPPNDRVRVRELEPEEGMLFGRTLQGAMGMPPWMAEWTAQLAGRSGWHLYVTEDPQDGAAIGCAAMFMNGDSAWLGIAATHPSARNRGGQRALMWRRLRDAQRFGARIATTETGEPMPGQPSPSFHNMIGCGFRVCGYRANWKASASNS